MKVPAYHKLLLAAWAGMAVFALMPVHASAAQETWFDRITQVTEYHQEIAKFQGNEQAYAPYLAQLEKVRNALNAGDLRKTYVAMNRLMDMLEADANGGEGIPRWSAKFLFDYCGQVTPPLYHDASRHLPKL
jgi:hypothetical protein